MTTRRNHNQDSERTVALDPSEETASLLEEETLEVSDETRRVEARAQELFAQWKAEELAKKGTKKPKPEKRKFDLPDGYIAPVGFRHALVEAGLAAESMSPVQIYGLVRKASTNGMPVKHFNREGTAHDEIQTHPTTGETLTRPGLKLDEGLEWWKNRPKPQPGKPKEKAEASDEAAAADDAAGELEDELAAERDEFVEAE